MISPTSGRSAIALMALALLAATACDDRPTAPITDQVVGATPSFNEIGEQEERIPPPEWDGEHSSHYTVASVVAALARTGFEGAITGITEVGGHFQAAVRSTPLQGFPLQGTSFLSISSGNATSPGSGLSNGLPCITSVPTYGVLCNVGGLNISLMVPAGATTVNFSYRYWTVDYCDFWDPFRVFLVAPNGTRTQIALSDLVTDIGCPPSSISQLKFSPHIRAVSADVSAYVGQTIVIEFRASDRLDGANAAGAIVDDLFFDTPVVKPAPTATFTAPAQVDEGTSANVAFASPSATGVRYAFACGADGAYGGISTEPTASCAAPDDPLLTVKGKVIDADDDNLFTEYTAEIEVENIAPTATISSNGPVDEGSAFELSLTEPHDVPADAAAGFSYAFDCGQGYALAGAASSRSCPTTDDGTRNVKAKVIDKDGGQTEYLATVTVNGVAPTASLNAPASVPEGTAIQISLSGAADVSSDDAAAGFTYAFDCGSGYGAFGGSSATSCPTTDNGTRAVRAKIRDDDGAFSEYSASVSITNVAPVVTAVVLPSGPFAVNTPLTVEANFTDVGTGDEHTLSFALGDGQIVAGTVNETGGSGSASASVAYSQAGVYTVTATATDDDGDSGSRSSALHAPAYVVVFDPSGGFVTGGGWIWSPAGAYTADPALSGKASFGFVSKYLPGATKPSGSTQFRFQAGNLTFKSESFDWLVVAGSKAKFRGVGTINGGGAFGFMVTAVDGKDGDGTDAFRIKIWNLSTDAVVYDNKLGEDDESPAATALGGGSIVIHK
jgi:hypothetical protein